MDITTSTQQRALAEARGHAIATRLDQSHALILRLFEARARERISRAHNQDRLSLIDELPILLKMIARELKTGRINQKVLRDLSTNHGDQRADQDYELEQILLEYQILSDTILEVLEESSLLPALSRNIILNALHIASRKAAAQYTLKKSKPTSSPLLWPKIIEPYGARSYAVSILGVVLATGLQLILWPTIKSAPYILYYPMLIVSSLFGEGWIALISSAFIAQYLFCEPLYSLRMTWPSDYVRNALYLISGSAIILLARVVRFSQRKANQARERSLAFAEQQNAHAEIAKYAVSADDSESLLNNSLTLILKVLKGDSAQILQRSSHANSFIIRVQCESTARGWRELNHQTIESPLAVYTLEGKSSIAVTDYAGESRFAVPAEHRDRGSSLSAPVPGHDRPFGVIIVNCHKTHEFSEDEKNFLAAVGNTLANALERRQVEISLKESEDRLRAVNTKLAEANRRLSGDAAELSRSNSELGRFAAIAAHDLKSPLNSISQFAELIQSDYGHQLDRTANEYFGFISQATARMRNLIDRLLSYSRVGARAEPFKILNCNLIFQSVKEDLEALITTANAEIIQENLPCVLGDEMELRQLFQNLLGNALKFRGKEDCRIHCRAEDAGAFWQFSIHDNGIGIDPVQAQHIFEPFKRLHNREFEGTGLGLAIAFRIVEHHGGKLWSTSTLGKGCTFHFTLPKAPSNI